MLLARAHDDAIYHNFDCVLVISFELRRFIQIRNDAVDASADIALGSQAFQDMLVLALAARDQWCEQHDTRPFWQGHHLIDHLAHCLGLQRLPVLWAPWLSNTRVQKAQVVVNFGDCPYRRARVVRGGLLLNRDRR